MNNGHSAPDEAALAGLAARLGHALQRNGDMVATAESCTGGWIAEAITSIAGSSAWFDRGFVTYSNAAKTQALGVPAEMIEKHGAVSEEVVLAMARGALAASEASLAVAVSGVAGPGGGSAAKPVGTVWLGFAESEGVTRAVHHCFAGDRQAVRAAAVAAALEGLIDYCSTAGA